jgi:CheY-like chemotaxis protein/two-component sensor histidine kinase
MELRNDTGSERERQIIGRQVAHLSRLVDDLLDISRITRGKIELYREPVDVKAVFGRALELTQPVLQKRNRPVDVDMPLHPVHVSGDAIRLTQVLCNLLTNAARHTPTDGRILLQLREAGEMVEMTVEDTGSGIAPDLLPRVFDIFVQGQQGIDRRSGGLGLGLAIVKALVELHGGTVSAATKGPDKGSTFVVRIPKADGTAVIRPESDIKPVPPTQTGGRILVVDDNLDAAETLTLLLQNVGYEVRHAANAESALASIESFHPEVALLDIGLPDVDGYELARRLRADLGEGKCKLIALTGYGSKADVEEAMKAGFDDHIVKPAELEHLLEVIAKLLNPINRDVG